MYAIKSVGRPVIDFIRQERQERGPFKTLEDFITRVNGREVNKRTIENLIKAGALDNLDGNRRQMTMIFPSILDNVCLLYTSGNRLTYSWSTDAGDSSSETDSYDSSGGWGATDPVSYTHLDVYKRQL